MCLLQKVIEAVGLALVGVLEGIVLVVSRGARQCVTVLEIPIDALVLIALTLGCI